MEVLKCVLLVSVLVLIAGLREVECNCQLSTSTDFGHPSPVYLQNGVFLAPNSRGDVTVARGASVTVACPGDRRYIVLGNYTTDVQDVQAQCVSNNTFRVGRWQGLFANISCNGQPWFSAEEIQTCVGRNKLYRVGYKIQKTFYSLYEACFDADLISTLYVKHELSPSAKSTQSGGSRPQFIEGGLFGKVRMSQLYKNKHQKGRINELLGEGMDQKYVTKNQFLTRGHLAPRADFPMRAMQRATFHYVNTAPQWMRGNAGDWAALEDGLRRRVQVLNRTVTLFTGTFGVLPLEDSRGEAKEIHLTSDANNNAIVPVPLYFYKLAYDPVRKTAAAFITINSSFYNRTVNDRLTFCSDICEGDRNYSWLKWRADDTHSFCCGYDEFVDKINFLPKLKVTGNFY